MSFSAHFSILIIKIIDPHYTNTPPVSQSFIGSLCCFILSVLVEVMEIKKLSLKVMEL